MLAFFFQANLGNLDDRATCLSIVTSNLALIQCQGIVVGFAASVFAAVMDTLTTGTFDWKHGLLLAAASIVTASIASFALGLVMVLVIVLSRKFRWVLPLGAVCFGFPCILTSGF